MAVVLSVTHNEYFAAAASAAGLPYGENAAAVSFSGCPGSATFQSIGLDPEEFFPADVKRYVAFFKSSRPVEPGGEVLVPGEPEIRNRRQRLAEGVPLPDDTWARIVAAARSVGLDEARIERVAAQ